MSDFLLQFGASNLCLSLFLAILAWVVQHTFRRPVLAHLLWLMVLVKLVTPPLFSLPLLPAVSSLSESSATAPATIAAFSSTAGAVTAAATPLASIEAILIAIWLLGSTTVFGWSLWRIRGFDRLLSMSAHRAPENVQVLARDLGDRLGLANVPTIHLTTAHVSPMVWWLGGRVRVYLPAELLRELGATQLRFVLAHELAHVRRRDHAVRWLEWLACVACWWNPVAWWARRNLRANEEVCCDALVLQTFRPKPHTYANSLLTVVEFLAAPAIRPPAIASEINSGGFLERRFRMIVSKTPIASTPRWLQATILLCTLGLMPLGIAQAQEPDVGAVGTRLRKAVQAGELTGAQARKMLDVLRTQSRDTKPAQTGSVEVAKRRDLELRAVKEQARHNNDAQARDLLEAGFGVSRRDRNDARGDLEGKRPRDEGSIKRMADAMRAAKEQHEVARIKLDDMRKQSAEQLDRETADRFRTQDREARDVAAHERAEARQKRADERKRRQDSRRDSGVETNRRTAVVRERRAIELEALARDLEIAVKTGALRKEEAAAKWAAVKRAQADQKADQQAQQQADQKAAQESEKQKRRVIR